MTTKHSSVAKLRKQAEQVARTLKEIESTGFSKHDVGGKIAAARLRPGVKFGIAMDDKILSVGILWSTVREMSEHAIAEWVLKYMREQQNAS